MMINDPMIPLALAISDFAHALATASDSSIDDAQLHADALFDLLDAESRADLAPLPAAIARPTDDLDANRYDSLRTSYLALLDARD